MATTRKTLKQYFRQYATPTEAQFAALIDSFVHKDEDSLPQSKIDGLVQALREKVTTNEVNTLVESKVSEIVSDPNFAAAPTAHSHAVSDVEGLGTRLTTLETSKTDYEAFKTLVSTFLNAVDASDTTINRWKELEAFLSGITDQETLAGLLLQLKNEITALIPAPAPTNYLKQIADLDAYTTAQEGEIVQYVGSTTAKYTRGYCYERVAGGTFHVPISSAIIAVNDNEYGIKPGNYYETDEPATEPIPAYINEHNSINTPFQTFISQDGNIIKVSVGVYPVCVLIPDTNPQLGAEIVRTIGTNNEDFTITEFSWQPIVTSPSVS
ncbi:MAG: hypothetical protein IKS00_08190 [Bacteroidales bacterium]|nr:hypothetical protein [Bacteroidales bacterium]